MMNCESVVVKTPTGPGGRSGPLAIDLAKGSAVVIPYSHTEATTAFQRTLSNHGWISAADVGTEAARKRARPPTNYYQQQTTTSAPFPVPPMMMTARAVPQPSAMQPQNQRFPSQQVIINPLSMPVYASTMHSQMTNSQSSREAQDRLKKRLHRIKKRDRSRPHSIEVVDLTAGDSSDEIEEEEEEQEKNNSDDDPIILISPSVPGPSSSVPKWSKLHHISDEISLPSISQAPAPARKEKTLEERLAAANAKTGLHLLPPPAHWEVTEDILHGKTVFVELNLPPHHPNAAKGTHRNAEKTNRYDDNDVLQLQGNGLSMDEAYAALDAAGGDLNLAITQLLKGSSAHSDESKIREIVMNGISRRDAEAALEFCDGSVTKALILCAECFAQGTHPASIARKSKRDNQNSTGQRDIAALKSLEEDRAAKRKAEAELKEVEEVLHRFKAIDPNRVYRIERVQNLERWSEYARCKARIARDIQGGPVNEQKLFHGAEKSVVATVCSEGFDLRVSNLSGALGAGIYFAQSSGYSDSYARQPRRTQDSSVYNPFMAMATPLPLPQPIVQPMMGGYSNFAAVGLSGLQQVAMAHQMPGRLPITSGYIQPMQAHLHRHSGVVPQPQGAVPQPTSKYPLPNFLSDGLAMLLCEVALGNTAPGQPGMRRPPAGYHSTGTGGIWAVFDNAQTYPAYCIHYK